MSSFEKNEKAVNTFTVALTDTNGYAFASGYLASYLTQVMDKLPRKMQEQVRAEMLELACKKYAEAKKRA